MSKVPCDPAGGNLRYLKHRRVACVVLARGVVMDTISRLYLAKVTNAFLQSNITHVRTEKIKLSGPSVEVCTYLVCLLSFWPLHLPFYQRQQNRDHNTNL